MKIEHPFLAGYPVIVRIPIQWGDMDAYGHVNNAVFFRLFESARIAYLQECGFLDSYETNQVGAILRSTECRFRSPIRYPDTVLVGARAIDIQSDRFTMGYAIVSMSQEAIVGEGSGVVVSFDYQIGKKTPLPDAVRAGIEGVENQEA